jgi:hypothetical protein
MASPKNPAIRSRQSWKHWLLKLMLAGSLFVVVAIVSLERELGERAWREYRAKATAKGLKLRWEDYVPPPIPDEENYAAAPIFQRHFTGTGNTDQTLKKLKLPELPRKKPGESESDSFDLQIWQKAFVKERWIPAAGVDPAADVLASLEKLEEPLSEIRQASQRPKSRWPVELGDAISAKYPHTRVLMSAATAFLLRARALLAQEKPDEALGELRHALRATQSLDGEPMLIPFLVRIAIWNQILSVMEQGIAVSEWKDAHLQTLVDETSNIEVLEALTFALTSERGFGNHYFEIFATGDRAALAKMASGIGADSSASTSAVLSFMPRGWIRRDQVEYNRLIDLDIQDIDAVNEKIDPRFSQSSMVIRGYSFPLERFSHMLTSMLLPVTESIAYRAFQTHARIRQLRVLCAIERHRQAHGELPSSLELLIPKLLESVPPDPMDGAPMRYRRTAEGGCVLWSIGKNRVDDGGTVGKPGSPNSKMLDWVVELPP